MRKYEFLKLRGQPKLGACAGSENAMRNYYHWHTQRSKNRDDRWRRGRERAITVQLGKPMVTSDENANTSTAQLMVEQDVH